MEPFNPCINEEYNIALNLIDRVTGLNLTLIERVNLRQIVQDSITRRNAVLSRHNIFGPAEDAVVLFLQGYYDIPYDADLAYLEKMEDERAIFRKQEGFDGYREFYRNIQDKKHHP